MPTTLSPPASLEERIAQVAAGLASEPGAATRAADGAQKHLVRMSADIADLIGDAKPEGMSMAAFLRQCAVRVALEHMERSQGT
jgi:DNA-directed RNA polymerase specialized sigma24 family protein